MNTNLNPSHEVRRDVPTQAVLTRRRFLKLAAFGGVTSGLISHAFAKTDFRLNYILSSSMYGTLPISEILPEAAKMGAGTIDIWPRAHGSQREQMEMMGHEKFTKLLKQYNVRLGCITRYDLGPFRLQQEMNVCARLGGSLLVCSGSGPKGLKGQSLKNAVKTFAEKMKPHAEAAEEAGVNIGIENHSGNLINTPDSLKWLLEFSASKNIGIAMAPYHLETLGLEAIDLANLVKQLENRLFIFYAWQHGMGCMKKLPKDQELLQMPGRGKLDFAPIVHALRAINYRGFTSIFMHPVPRGIPILPTAAETTDEILRARTYLDKCLS